MRIVGLGESRAAEDGCHQSTCDDPRSQREGCAKIQAVLLVCRSKPARGEVVESEPERHRQSLHDSASFRLEVRRQFRGNPGSPKITRLCISRDRWRRERESRPTAIPAVEANEDRHRLDRAKEDRRTSQPHDDDRESMQLFGKIDHLLSLFPGGFRDRDQFC